MEPQPDENLQTEEKQEMIWPGALGMTLEVAFG